MANENHESRTEQTVDTISHIINAILAAGVIGLGSMVVSNNTELAAMRTQLESVDGRILAIDHDIGDRYRRTDAEADHRETKEDLHREFDKLGLWVQRIHESVDRLDTQIALFPGLEDDVRKLEKQTRKHELKKDHQSP